MDAILIKKDQFFNYSYASTRWTQWGQPTNIPVLFCDTWEQCFETARFHGYQLVLFMNSGTVFNDIERFIDDIKQYPHRGLVGHIIDPLDPGKFYSLHQQCFLVDIRDLDPSIFQTDQFFCRPVKRSPQNMHDNYTPLWLRPLPGPGQSWKSSDFGQKIIAHFINRGLTVSNWHQKIRNNKIYLYTDALRDEWIQSQTPYLDLAEQHLWILNNQDISTPLGDWVICPASGLFWMISAITADQIDLVDISAPQLDLAESLLKHWDGNDYGRFVHDFIIKRKIRHMQFDDPSMTDDQKFLLVSQRQNFCDYVNKNFIQQLSKFNLTIEDFVSNWPSIQNTKISFNRGNLINWLMSTDIDANTTIWLSNILNYKYTWLKSTGEEITALSNYLEKSGAQILL